MRKIYASYIVPTYGIRVCACTYSVYQSLVVVRYSVNCRSPKTNTIVVEVDGQVVRLAFVGLSL